MTGPFDLSGKTALVTEDNTGLGQAIAVALAKAGAALVGVGRSTMDETAHRCAEMGAAFQSIEADLATTEPIARILEADTRLTTSSHFGFLGCGGVGWLGWGRLRRCSAGRARWRPRAC